MFAKYYKRDGWFRLIPPRAVDRLADYYFREFDAMQNFASACGWILSKAGKL